MTKSACKTPTTSSDSTVSILDSTLKILGTQEQMQLDLLSTVAVVQTYALPSGPEWRGVYEGDGLARGVFVDLVEINFSAEPILTIE
jgi:hypothetical protein